MKDHPSAPCGPKRSVEAQRRTFRQLPISSGVKQGYVHASSLFCIFFSMMLRERSTFVSVLIAACSHQNHGAAYHRTVVCWRLCIPRTHRSCSPMPRWSPQGLRVHYQPKKDVISSLHLWKPASLLTLPLMAHAPLNAVEHFTYLVSVMCNNATKHKDLDNRLSKTSSSLGRLKKRVWKSRSLRLTTKIKMHTAVFIPTPCMVETPGHCTEGNWGFWNSSTSVACET